MGTTTIMCSGSKPNVAPRLSNKRKEHQSMKFCVAEFLDCHLQNFARSIFNVFQREVSKYVENIFNFSQIEYHTNTTIFIIEFREITHT